MSEKFNSDSFAPFLETITRSASKAAPGAPGTGDIILENLAAAPGSKMDVASLFTASDLPVDTFANALRTLETMGLLVTRVENSQQVAALSAKGVQAVPSGLPRNK